MTLLYLLIDITGAVTLVNILFHTIHAIEHPRRGKRERREPM
jgi:hypothetical protein